MTKPTAAECNAAFAVIDKAEAHILGLMKAANIPGASVSVWPGDYGPEVNLRASRRVFINVDGKRNLESTRCGYGNVEKTIDEVAEHLKAKRAA